MAATILKNINNTMCQHQQRFHIERTNTAKRPHSYPLCG